MYTLNKKFFCIEDYKIIQIIVTFIQIKILIWLFKHKDSKNRLYFDIKSKLKLTKFEIKIIEYEDKSVKLKSLID